MEVRHVVLWHVVFDPTLVLSIGVLQVLRKPRFHDDAFVVWQPSVVCGGHPAVAVLRIAVGDRLLAAILVFAVLDSQVWVFGMLSSGF